MTEIFTYLVVVWQSWKFLLVEMGDMKFSKSYIRSSVFTGAYLQARRGSPHRKPYYFPSSFLQSRFERHTTIPIELVEVLQLFWVGVSGARYQRIGGLLQSYIYFSLCFQIAWAILGHDEDRNMSDCCMSSHSTFSLHDSHIWDLHYRFLNLSSNSARQQACGLDQYHQETTLSQLFDWLETNCAEARRHIYLLHL